MIVDTHKIRPGINLQVPALRANPFSLYARMREHYPVCQVEPYGQWAVSCFEDVQYVLSHPKLFSSAATNMLFEAEWLSDDFRNPRLIVAQDPPDHTYYQSLVNKAFAHRAIANLAPIMRSTAQSLLRKLERESVDFVAEFAYPYIGKLTRHMIGLGDTQSLAELREWVELEETNQHTRPDDSFIKAYEAAVRRQNCYFNDIIEEKRKNPRNDVATTLVNAEVMGEKLTDKALYSIMGLLIVASFVTTIQVLNHAIIQLSRQPSLLAKLIKSPDLIPAFIEELLRYTTPAYSAFRIATTDVELSGVTIPKGALVLALLASANRDPSQFPNPDVFELSRPSIKQHLSFSYGVHTCIGAALARLEVEIALKTLLSRFSAIRCPADDQLPWLDSVFMRGVTELPVSFK